MPSLHRDTTDPDFESLRQQAHALGDHCPDKSLWIACTDRVLDRPLHRICVKWPAIIMRTAGNQVPASDAARFRELSAINYAVERLQVRDIVVCGHSLCFATSENERADGLPAGMVGQRDVLHRVSRREAANQRTRDHVIDQLQALKRYPSVCRALERGDLRLHGLFYLVESGLFSRFEPHTRQFHPLGLEPS